MRVWPKWKSLKKVWGREVNQEGYEKDETEWSEAIEAVREVVWNIPEEADEDTKGRQKEDGIEKGKGEEGK